jgi:hypothetical protein
MPRKAAYLFWRHLALQQIAPDWGIHASFNKTDQGKTKKEAVLF